ncbi:MAG: hypothetical protein LHV69_03550 [Elusimicrobia bacterium]|nr:hypothetical protein [Candidatus Obscuribacterium magneticum]
MKNRRNVMLAKGVTLAEAGGQDVNTGLDPGFRRGDDRAWIPAFAGMTILILFPALAFADVSIPGGFLSTPYIMNQPGERYVLEDDVHAEGTALWFSGENITLDLNGHTIFYDELDIPVLPQRDFEVSSIADLTAAGWQIPPDAQIAVDIRTINERNLHLLNTGGSTVLSPAFQIPRANYTFVASCFVNGLTPEDVLQTLTIDFINADTGEAYPPGIGLPAAPLRYNYVTKDGREEAWGVVCTIRLPDTPRVRIRMRTDGPMWIDYVDFRGFFHPAVASKRGSVNPGHQYFATADMPSGIGNTSVMNIRNGRIVQGNARSGKALVAYGAENIQLEDLTIIMQDTPDNRGIQQIMEGGDGVAGGHVINRVTIEVPTVNVFWRDELGAALMLNGPAAITNCTIRTDTGGILLYPGGQNYREGVQITDNNFELGFRHASMARNHYAAWVQEFTRPVIARNSITGIGEGGINIADCLEADVSYNTIDIAGKEDLRFQSTRIDADVLTVSGIVIRDYGYDRADSNFWSTRNRVHHNNVKVTSDPSKMKAECRLRVFGFWNRNRGVFDQTRAGGNLIYDNTFEAINLHSTRNSYGTPSIAAALAFEVHAPTMKDQYFNNTLRGNNFLIFDGMLEEGDRGVEVTNNRLVKLDVGVTPAVRLINGVGAPEWRPFEWLYFWNGHGLVERDNIWEGTSKYDYWKNRWDGTFRSENTLTIQVFDRANRPLQSAGVTALDKDGRIVAQAYTDAGGQLKVPLTEFQVLGYNSETLFNPYTVTVAYNGVTHMESLTMREPTTITVILDVESLVNEVGTAVNLIKPGVSDKAVFLFGLDVSKKVNIKIYNRQGLVKKVKDETFEAGSHAVEWAGDNDEGEPVSSGIYTAMIDIDGQKTIKKVAVMR